MDRELQNNIHNAEINFNYNIARSNILNGNNFVAWTKTYILEIVDEIANAYTASGTIIQIPELTMNLSITLEEDIFRVKTTVLQHLRAQIEAYLKKAIKENEIHQITVAQAKANTVLAYIKTAQLSSKLSASEWQDAVDCFFQELMGNPVLRENWIRTIGHKGAFVRFFRLKSVSEQQEFLEAYVQEENVLDRLNQTLYLFNANPDYFLFIPLLSFYERIYQLLAVHKGSLTKALQEMILQQMIHQTITVKNITVPKLLTTELRQALFLANKEKGDRNEKNRGKTAIAKTKDRLGKLPKVEGDDVVELLKDGSYISQAGLVLLANFLPQFFKNAGYLDKEGAFIEAREIPIVLHYMATGETEVPEWKLTLPKILAGLRPGQHCNTGLQPTTELKKQIDALFAAAIGHWKALKNTSIEGFRETFLNREGVLQARNGFYYLDIEEQTLDILLNYVPWNYTTIRLNWMQSILFVTWNKS